MWRSILTQNVAVFSSVRIHALYNRKVKYGAIVLCFALGQVCCNAVRTNVGSLASSDPSAVCQQHGSIFPCTLASNRMYTGYTGRPGKIQHTVSSISYKPVIHKHTDLKFVEASGLIVVPKHVPRGADDLPVLIGVISFTRWNVQWPPRRAYRPDIDV